MNNLMNEDKIIKTSKPHTSKVNFGIWLGLITLFSILGIYYRLNNKVFGELVFRNRGALYTVSPDDSGLVKLVNQNIYLATLGLEWHRFKITNYKYLPHLFNISSDMNAQWSPDASHIAYRSSVDGMSHIYLLSTNREGEQRLTYNVNVLYFSWLNGKEILAATLDGQVYLLDTESRQVSAIPCLSNGFMDVSPDGYKVVAGNRNGISSELLVVSLDCSQTTIIAQHDIGICDASWSPSIDEILFVKANYVTKVTQNGDAFETFECNQIFRANSDGSNQVRLDNDDYSSKYYIEWSPDGERIAFATNDVHYVQDMYVMNRDGSDLIRLTNSPAYDGYPIWSPDSNELAFGYNDDVKNESGILIYNMNDSTLRPIAVNQYGGNSISWRP